MPCNPRSFPAIFFCCVLIALSTQCASAPAARIKDRDSLHCARIYHDYHRRAQRLRQKQTYSALFGLLSIPWFGINPLIAVSAAASTGMYTYDRIRLNAIKNDREDEECEEH